ncbi:MAG: polymer-forming cytoskeletal protein [Methylacidiphilaceae bacterium]|nr:polymer-forming cytoskeletal protein [Candidatus Methylacidiphilaceae bacterium]
MPETPLPAEEATVIGTGTRLRGTIAFQGSFVIHGDFAGKIHAPEGTVRIGPEGRVQAEIEAAELQVEGKARGSLFAHDSIELCRGAEVQGNMRCARLRIEREAAFDGHCECFRPPSQEPEPVLHRCDLHGFFTALQVASLRP